MFSHTHTANLRVVQEHTQPAQERHAASRPISCCGTKQTNATACVHHHQPTWSHHQTAAAWRLDSGLRHVPGWCLLQPRPPLLQAQGWPQVVVAGMGAQTPAHQSQAHLLGGASAAAQSAVGVAAACAQQPTWQLIEFGC